MTTEKMQVPLWLAILTGSRVFLLNLRCPGYSLRGKNSGQREEKFSNYSTIYNILIKTIPIKGLVDTARAML